MVYTLYRLEFASGKSYVGQTVRALKVRMNAHRTATARGSMLPVHCAWRAHGEPSIEVVGQFDTHDDLHAAEIALIESVGTLSPGGYNVSRGGDTAPSTNPSVAAKIAAAAKGRKYSDVTPWKESSKRMWQDPAYVEKVSAGLKASWTDERRAETKARMDVMWSKRRADGWKMPESTKERMRGKVFTEETRAKMSAAAKGKPKAPRSDETRARLSAALKAKWASMTAEDISARAAAISAGQSREKAVEAAKKRWQDPAYRAAQEAAVEARRLNAPGSAGLISRPPIPLFRRGDE